MANFNNKMDMPLTMVTTGAFPLDAKSYFESYADAEAAAAGAAEAGTEGKTYYFGQTLTVVEDGTATSYIIQPDCTLAPIGSGTNNGNNTSLPGSEGLTYIISEDETYATCTGMGSCTETDIVIASTYEGLPVTSIDSNAFYGCSSLTGVTIPDSITSIGDSAFYDCTNLIYNEFNNAYYLGNENNPYVVLMKAKNKSITSCEINSNTKFIHSNVFYNCTSLTNITIPDSVKSINYYAFSNCTSLTSVTIGNSVTGIGFSAFAGCSSLTSITIPRSVTSIGKYAFSGCSSLLQEENGVLYVDKWVVDYNTAITTVSLRNNTVGICDSAFAGCTSLISITIPNNVKSIGYGVFADCAGLISITIPDSITSISDYAFDGCTSLASVTIPDGVESIGGGAFRNCPTLISITIPDSITSIGYTAFRSCSNLTSIEIPDSVTSIGYSAFQSCSSLTIYCEAKSKRKGWHDSWNLNNRPVIWGYTGSVSGLPEYDATTDEGGFLRITSGVPAWVKLDAMENLIL